MGILFSTRTGFEGLLLGNDVGEPVVDFLRHVFDAPVSDLPSSPATDRHGAGNPANGHRSVVVICLPDAPNTQLRASLFTGSKEEVRNP